VTREALLRRVCCYYSTPAQLPCPPHAVALPASFPAIPHPLPPSCNTLVAKPPPHNTPLLSPSLSALLPHAHAHCVCAPGVLQQMQQLQLPLTPQTHTHIVTKLVQTHHCCWCLVHTNNPSLSCTACTHAPTARLDVPAAAAATETQSRTQVRSPRLPQPLPPLH
jgi:hypothetical protein